MATYSHWSVTAPSDLPSNGPEVRRIAKHIFKMSPTLIFVVPIGRVELQVFPSVVDFPVRFKTNSPVSVFFQDYGKYFLCFSCRDERIAKNWIFQVGQHQLAQNRKEVIPIRFLLVLRNEGRENSDPQINQDRV